MSTRICAAAADSFDHLEKPCKQTAAPLSAVKKSQGLREKRPKIGTSAARRWDWKFQLNFGYLEYFCCKDDAGLSDMLVGICRVVLCSTRPLIRGTGTTGEARETGAPLIVGGGAAAEEKGLAKNNVSLRRAKIHACTHTHTHRRAEEYRQHPCMQETQNNQPRMR